MKTGIELIAEERKKQLLKWDAEHDAQHDGGQLAIVAATLAVLHTDAYVTDPGGFGSGENPWNLEHKCKKPVDALISAGALIAAEIDRRLKISFDILNS